MRKIYHLVPPRVEGSLLKPLNELKEEFPQLYEQHAAKYQGREELMNENIPKLGCKWNDVLQFSPVHPELIRNALLEAGFGWQAMLFFEIDPSAVGMNATNTVFFLHKPRERGDFKMYDDEFVPLTPDLPDDLFRLPQATLTHFAEAKASNSRPFLFLWVPHVLYKGHLVAGDLPIIEVK